MKAKDYNDYLNKMSYQELRAETRKQFTHNRKVTVIAICSIAVSALLTVGMILI